MININRDEGYIILSRCDYLYRYGLRNRDEKANREMGDGDIIIPLPPHMVCMEHDNRYGDKSSDGQDAEIIIAEIRKRLGCDDDYNG